MKFTKEEIRLCKQVAGRHRKPLEYGDRYLAIPKNKKAVEEICLYDAKIDENSLVFSSDIITTVLLWTISDCLEFLRKNIGVWYELKGITHGPPYNEPMKDFIFRAYKIETFAKTPLEACLKAVLAVVGEK